MKNTHTHTGDLVMLSLRAIGGMIQPYQYLQSVDCASAAVGRALYLIAIGRRTIYSNRACQLASGRNIEISTTQPEALYINHTYHIVKGRSCAVVLAHSRNSLCSVYCNYSSVGTCCTDCCVRWVNTGIRGTQQQTTRAPMAQRLIKHRASN